MRTTLRGLKRLILIHVSIPYVLIGVGKILCALGDMQEYILR